MKTFKGFLKEESKTISSADEDRYKKISKIVRDVYSRLPKDKQKTEDELIDLVDFLATVKNFGNKTIDKMDDEYGVPPGRAITITKELKDELRSLKPVTQSQAKRIDRYLKQKWIKLK